MRVLLVRARQDECHLDHPFLVGRSLARRDDKICSLPPSPIINTVTAVNFTAANSTITSATTTNLATTDLRISSLDCTGYANGGTLTTDGSGNVVCATDDGGAGSSVAGSDTQVQFNSGGGFAAAASFTFASSSGKLAVPYASKAHIMESRWQARAPDGSWLSIPPTRVIHDRGNPVGEPILCAARGPDGEWRVLCFVPGGLM